MMNCADVNVNRRSISNCNALIRICTKVIAASAALLLCTLAIIDSCRIILPKSAKIINTLNKANVIRIFFLHQFLLKIEDPCRCLHPSDFSCCRLVIDNGLEVIRGTIVIHMWIVVGRLPYRIIVTKCRKLVKDKMLGF